MARYIPGEVSTCRECGRSSEETEIGKTFRNLKEGKVDYWRDKCNLCLREQYEDENRTVHGRNRRSKVNLKGFHPAIVAARRRTSIAITTYFLAVTYTKEGVLIK